MLFVPWRLWDHLLSLGWPALAIWDKFKSPGVMRTLVSLFPFCGGKRRFCLKDLENSGLNRIKQMSFLLDFQRTFYVLLTL